MRDVTIKAALNGYVVRLGCQRVVFTDRALMLRALDDYLSAPEKVESQYMFGSINSKQLGFERSNRNVESGTVASCAETLSYQSNDED